MGTHLCFHCARIQGYSTNAETELLLGTEYQILKFVKHTRPDRVYEVNSLFNDPSSNAYRELVVSAAAAGSVEIDHLGRASFLWVAGTPVGATYRDGQLWHADDAVKVVLPFDEDRVHGYPVGSSGLTQAVCANCGAPILS